MEDINLTKPERKKLVTFLLDESYSMMSIASQTLEGMNSYINGLREEKNDIIFNLVSFNSFGVTKRIVDESVKNVKDLTSDNYKPDGGTPLIDAAYKTIEATERAAQKYDHAVDVIIVIQTDGQENQSSQYNAEQLRGLINRMQQKYDWQFVFMGAGIDAYQDAGRFGISRGSTFSYGLDNTKQAFDTLTASTRSYVSGATASMNFSSAQKSAVGDLYDGDEKK